MTEIVLTEEQKHALDKLPFSKYAVLVGCAGSGKTTTSSRIIEKKIALLEQRGRRTGTPFYRPLYDRMNLEYDSQRETYHTTAAELQAAQPESPHGVDCNGYPLVPSVAFCAFTSRASLRLAEMLPAHLKPLCTTLHSLLKVRMARNVVKTKTTVQGGKEHTYQELGSEFRPTFDASQKLPIDFIVIDEASMLSVDHWEWIRDAIHPDTHVLLIGDIQQLPPIGSPSVLPKGMTDWGYAALTKTMRTNEMSIINASQAILRGERPVEGENFRLVNINNGGGKKTDDLAVQQWLVKFITALIQNKKYNYNEDVILVANRKETQRISVNAINEKLLPIINPGERTEVTCGQYSYKLRPGDRVAFTHNNGPAGYINGSTGTLLEIRPNHEYTVADRMTEEQLMEYLNRVDEAEEEDLDDSKVPSHFLVVQLDNGTIVEVSNLTNYKDLSIGYVNTIISSQGCEYNNCFIVCTSHDWSINREGLYTAVTRAKNKAVLIYDPEGINAALKRQALPGITIEEKLAHAQYKEKKEARKKGPKYKPTILPTNVTYEGEL